MTQTDLPTIDGTPGTGTPGTTLAGWLNAWKATLYSGFAGAARPSFAVASMIWTKTVSGTAHEVYYYDGTNDTLLFTVNPTTDRVRLPNISDIFANSSNTYIDVLGTPVNGLSWDYINSYFVLSNSAGVAARIARHGSDGAVLQFVRNNAIVGGIAVTTTATSYVTSSDYRLKYDVETIVTFDLDRVAALGGPLGKLMRLRPVKYKMFQDPDANQLYGFIAHEVQEEVPHAVTGFKDQTEEQDVIVGYVDDAGNPDGPQLPVTERKQVAVMQGIDHSQLMSLAIAAIEQLTLRVMDLEARLAPGDEP